MPVPDSLAAIAFLTAPTAVPVVYRHGATIPSAGTPIGIAVGGFDGVLHAVAIRLSGMNVGDRLQSRTPSIGYDAAVASGEYLSCAVTGGGLPVGADERLVVVVPSNGTDWPELLVVMEGTPDALGERTA